MNFVIYEDNKIDNFNPLTKTRPFQFLLSGCLTFYDRYKYIAKKYDLNISVRSNKIDILKQKYNLENFKPSNNKCIFVNSRVKSSEKLLHYFNQELKEEFILINDDTILGGFVLDSKLENLIDNKIDLFDDIKKIKVNETTYNYLWNIVHINGDLINNDYQLIKHRFNKVETTKYPNVTFLNPDNIFISKNVKIKAGTIIDGEEGSVIIDSDTMIMHNSVIIGPCYLGIKSTVKIGAKIYENCSFGSTCKIGGEIEDTIVIGYSNKQHDGFLGHAYIGEWCNFGADSNNSDLKNNYSDILVEINGKLINSNSMFVGLFMGDHSKTGINTMLNTGTVIGIGCNVFGGGFPAKNIPDLHWGGKDKIIKYPTKRIIETAKTVMNRRNINMTKAEEDFFQML